MKFKAQINHPVFLWREGEAVIIGDGVNEVQFTGLDLFLAAEPGFVLPDGAVQINYEIAPSRGIHQVVLAGGQVTEGQYPDAAFEAYLAKVDVYSAFLDEAAHPLHGITDLAQAQAVAKRMIIQALEEVFNAQNPTAGYMAFEQGTFERQLAEAQAYKADPANAATPWLSAILKDGETVDQLADLVITNHVNLRNAASTLMHTKRNTIQAMEALATPEEIRSFTDAFIANLAAQG